MLGSFQVPQGAGVRDSTVSVSSMVSDDGWIKDPESSHHEMFGILMNFVFFCFCFFLSLSGRVCLSLSLSLPDSSYALLRV